MVPLLRLELNSLDYKTSASPLMLQGLNCCGLTVDPHGSIYSDQPIVAPPLGLEPRTK